MTGNTTRAARLARLLGWLGAVAVAAGLSACGDTSANPSGSVAGASCASGSASASGSTALQPLVQKAADAYRARCSAASVNVAGGGSSKGIGNVVSGVSDIGDSDIPASSVKGVDASQLQDHQVAIVVFAVAVNPKAGIANLTSAQIRDLFQGRVTNWSQVGGKDLPVTLYERKAGSGTRFTFDRIMLNGGNETDNAAKQEDATNLVLQDVAGAPGGVTYLNAAQTTAGAVPVSIDGHAPTAAEVASGAYPLFSHEHMYTRSDSSPAAVAFVNYVMSSDFQATVSGLGYLPVSATSRESAADS